MLLLLLLSHVYALPCSHPFPFPTLLAKPHHPATPHHASPLPRRTCIHLTSPYLLSPSTSPSPLPCRTKLQAEAAEAAERERQLASAEAEAKMSRARTQAYTSACSELTVYKSRMDVAVLQAEDQVTRLTSEAEEARRRY